MVSKCLHITGWLLVELQCLVFYFSTEMRAVRNHCPSLNNHALVLPWWSKGSPGTSLIKVKFVKSLSSNILRKATCRSSHNTLGFLQTSSGIIWKQPGLDELAVVWNHLYLYMIFQTMELFISIKLEIFLKPLPNIYISITFFFFRSSARYLDFGIITRLDVYSTAHDFNVKCNFRLLFSRQLAFLFIQIIKGLKTSHTCSWGVFTFPPDCIQYENNQQGH